MLAFVLLLLTILLPRSSSAGPVPTLVRARLIGTGKIGSDVVDALATQERVRVMIAFAVPEVQARSAAQLSRVARRQAIRRVREQIVQKLHDGDLERRHEFKAVSAMTGLVSGAGLARLADDPSVMRVDVDTGGHAELTEAVPLTHLDVVQQWGFTGRGVTAAVIDSGADTDHPDLADSIVAQHCFCEACGNFQCDRLVPCCPDGTAEQDGSGSAEDDAGHGTNVTGILTSNGTIAPRGGAPDVQVVLVKVLDSSAAFATSAQVVSGLDWVLDTRPDVRIVNMSLGTNARYTGDCDSTNPQDAKVMAFTEAVNALRQSGVTVFASSGNQNSGTSMPLPACVAASISVGAVWDSNVGSQTFPPPVSCTDPTTAADQVTCFSNSDESTDVFAPGGPMTSTGLNGRTSTFRGTSQSSPIAAACAAVLLDAHPELTPDQIEAALKTSPTLVTDPKNGRSFPRVDCEAALLSLGPLPPSRTPTASPTASPTPTSTVTGSLPPTFSPTPTETSPPSATPTTVASPTPTEIRCVGDCNGSFSVSIDELVLGVNIALDRAALSQCTTLDRDGNGHVTVDELVASVGNALASCH